MIEEPTITTIPTIPQWTEKTQAMLDHEHKTFWMLCSAWILSSCICFFCSITWFMSMNSLSFLNSLYVFVAFFICPIACGYDDYHSSLDYFTEFLTFLGILRMIVFLFGIYLLTVHSFASNKASASRFYHFLIITAVSSLGNATMFCILDQRNWDQILQFAAGVQPLTPSNVSTKIWLVFSLPTLFCFYAYSYHLFLLHFRSQQTKRGATVDGNYLHFKQSHV